MTICLITTTSLKFNFFRQCAEKNVMVRSSLREDTRWRRGKSIDHTNARKIDLPACSRNELLNERSDISIGEEEEANTIITDTKLSIK